MMQVIRDGIASRERIDNYSTLLELRERNLKKRQERKQLEQIQNSHRSGGRRNKNQTLTTSIERGACQLDDGKHWTLLQQKPLELDVEKNVDIYPQMLNTLETGHSQASSRNQNMQIKAQTQQIQQSSSKKHRQINTQSKNSFSVKSDLHKEQSNSYILIDQKSQFNDAAVNSHESEDL